MANGKPGRTKEFDWVLSVAFTPEQASIIEKYSSENDVPFRQAVRDLFDTGADAHYSAMAGR